MYELIPFWSWRKVIFEHDFMLLEENLLNMLLFVPIGGLLELCLKRIKWKQASKYRIRDIGRNRIKSVDFMSRMV